MANRAHVPGFGDWEKQSDAPYTVIFSDVRKSRGKNPQNSSDKREKAESFSSDQGSPPRAAPTAYRRQMPKQRSQEHMRNREEEEYRGYAPSLAHSDKNSRVRPHQPPPAETFAYQPYGGRGAANPPEINRRQQQQQPPPQPSRNRVQGKVSHGFAKGVVIPPFPGSGNSNVETSYTHIFEQVKHERNREGGGRPYPYSHGTPQDTPAPLINRHSSPHTPQSCCFPWSRKSRK